MGKQKTINIKVTKASGIIEDLNPNKLRASLIRSGADKEQVEEIIEKVLYETEPYTNTKKIYRLAHKYLRQFNHASGLRYSLKRALFRLGPAGYHFEKYFGEILKYYGYDVTVGVLLNGKRVKHEVDVFAVKNNEVSLIECKYHNRAGYSTDIKVALYVNARFHDLRHAVESQYPGRSYTPWLVTNTRCTSDAIEYAKGSGLRVKSWRYPDNGSLEKLIEDKRLYPVTIIAGIKSGLIRILFEHNIILLKDLTEMEVKNIRKMLSLPEKKAFALKRQADSLCVA